MQYGAKQKCESIGGSTNQRLFSSFHRHARTHTQTAQSTNPELCLNLHFPAAQFVAFHKHSAHQKKEKENVNINLLTFSSLICCLAQLNADYFLFMSRSCSGHFTA